MIHVIQSVGSLAPETGGPARSVPNLALSLADLGVKITLLTVDFGEGFSPALVPEHPRIEVVSVPARVLNGLRPIVVPGLRKTIREITRERTNLLIHDHGIWLPQNWLVCNHAIRNGIPLVISPRGMLEPGALARKKLKKQAAWLLVQKRLIQGASALHAASPKEEVNLGAMRLAPPLRMIPNGTILPPLRKIDTVRRQTTRLLFISRIHPIKGLLTLVGALAQLGSYDWHLTIAGYDEVGHQQAVLNAAQKENIADRITFTGPLENTEKWSYYQDADLFILPSYSENFGIVVAESLAAGTPVITTTGTPWKELPEKRCGWWVEPDVEGVGTALKEALSTSRQELAAMGQRGRQLIEEHYSWKVIGREMLDFYQDILAHSGTKKGIDP